MLPQLTFRLTATGLDSTDWNAAAAWLNAPSMVVAFGWEVTLVSKLVLMVSARPGAAEAAKRAAAIATRLVASFTMGSSGLKLCSRKSYHRALPRKSPLTVN